MQKLLALSLVALCTNALAADRWICLTSPNFELFTLQGERKARQTILYFEQVREFFRKALNATPDSKSRVRIVLFGSEEQFKPYRFNEFAAAYYQPGIDRDYIVMGGYSPQSETIAIHEYVHLVVKHSGLELPVWLNEGLADLYSTLKPVASSVQIGHLHPGRMYQLQGNWMPLERLLNVSHSSPEYNRKAHAGTFYAESWALTHMLYLSTEYRSKWSPFLVEILRGIESTDALQKTYGKPIREIEKDLSAYVKNNDRFYAAIFPVKFEEAKFRPDVREVSPASANAVLASLLTNTRNPDAAQALLDDLEKNYAEEPGVAEALGYAYWRSNKLKKAEQYLSKAMEPGPPSVKLLYDAARLQLAGGKPSPAAETWLLKALETEPGWQDARLRLMEYYLTVRRYDRCLALIPRFGKVKPEMATRLFVVAAYAEAGSGSLASARETSKRAVQYAKTMYDKESVDRLQSYLTQMEEAKKRGQVIQISAELKNADFEEREDLEIERPRLVRKSGNDERIITVDRGDVVETAEGSLVQVDCLTPKARLHIKDKRGTKIALMIHDPESVIIRSGLDAQLTCGEQSNPVRVDFVVKAEAEFGTQGIVKILEFPKQ